jgi:hypothetical protein
MRTLILAAALALTFGSGCRTHCDPPRHHPPAAF